MARWVMMFLVQVLEGEAAVVLLAIGVAAGAGHGLVMSSYCQLTETPLQTGLPPLSTVRASVRSAQSCNGKSDFKLIKTYFHLVCP